MQLLIDLTDDDNTPLSQTDAVEAVTDTLMNLPVTWSAEIHGPDAKALAPLLRRRMPSVWDRARTRFKVHR